jgi:hypothetical protein
MKVPTLALVLVSFLSAVAIAQQPASDASQKNIMVVGELTHAIDVKKAKVGDKVTLRLVHNVGANGKVVVPYKKGKVIGHISQVQPPSKENPQSMVAIEFDKIEIKGGSDLPITATIRAMTPPDHHMIRHSSGIPTSGDDSIARAAGPMVDSNGRTVNPPPAPLTQPGPRAAASNDRSSEIDGVDFESNPATHTTVITASKKSLWIEDGTRITLAAQSPAL